MRLNIDQDWRFILSDDKRYKEYMFDHSTWKKINLPHDWAVTGSFDKRVDAKLGFLRAGVGWYRKILFIDDEIETKKFFVDFDGVYMNSEVYINGHLIGKRPYGYISFSYEISDYIQKGMNIIAVRVNTGEKATGRWYTGSGINQHVYLRMKDSVYFPIWGSYIRTTVYGDQAKIRSSITLKNPDGQSLDCKIVSGVFTMDGLQIAHGERLINLDKEEEIFEEEIKLNNPKLWSIELPNRYIYKIAIMTDHKIIDSHEEIFGIRKAEFIPNKGFFLNNVPTKFKGVCLHPDVGVIGTAVSERLFRKRILMLKEMGCNAIRTAHNPFPPAFYDLCDEIGMMVIDEIFDGWDQVKAEGDYGLYFEEWHERDVCDFIQRDRNHPCVIAWSIGNEVTNMAIALTKKLQNMVHGIDATRSVTCGVQGSEEISENNRALLDIAGYNDGGGACFLYERDHQTRPEQLFIATEAPHTYQTRGFYRTQTWWRDKNQPRIEIDNLTEEEIFFDGHESFHSSYDNAGVRTCVRDSWKLSEDHDYLCGEFRWTGFDYYGESFEWPSHYVGFGVIDVANFKKDHYYLYQSMWSQEPMVHMLPHWTHRHLHSGTIVPVWVYTNCEEVEVFLNGNSMGKKEKGNLKNICYNIPYTEGHLEVVAYTDGVEMTNKAFSTAKSPCQLRMISDKEDLAYSRGDYVQISVEIIDNNGELVPYAENSVSFMTSKELELIGTENGNSVDHTPLTARVRKAFNGLCMGIVRQEIEGGNPKIESGNPKIYVASVLGDTVFNNSTSINIDIKGMSLDGEPEDLGRLDIYYTDDGSEPTRQSKLFCQPFEIHESTLIKVLICDGNKMLGRIEGFFFKGEIQKVIDLTHGNKDLNLDYPLGPYAKELVGKWNDGEITYEFRENGEFVRILERNDQVLGMWWYDYPLDHFEAQDYAGTGEVWLKSGEKCSLSLKSQKAKVLILDNNKGGIGTSFGHEDTILLSKGV